MSKMSNAKPVWRVACAVALLGGLAACHTVGGAGRDVSAVGNSVSSGANAVNP